MLKRAARIAARWVYFILGGESKLTSQYKIAADVGGTFTDIALRYDDGRLATRKVPSTPDDYARGVIRGILELLAAVNIAPSEISDVLHGCTIATNAILELKGASTALLTTRGFRDILELRRTRVPRLYDPLYVKPEPLVPRNWRFEITERLAADGSVLVDLIESEVLAVARKIRATRIESIAICFLHSYANPVHEQQAVQILRTELPSRFITASVEILPEIREYERTSTTVINAYVGPPVKQYIGKLAEELRRVGIRGRLLVMQSSGGTLDAESVMEQPARIIECGPAAGVIGAAHHAARSGYNNVISFDMGGTTAKASLIEAGQIAHTDEYEVGGGISLSSRLVKGGGYALKVPVIDISEVGAGGGSKVWFDAGGALKVGPESAGAMPGPACYAAGGFDATVTDANVVLGYLNPTALAGGTVPIEAALARSVITQEVARRVDNSAEEAAWWVFAIATASMVRAVKAVSTYRGRNPTDFVLMAFGGNGGIFASELLRQLQMKRALVPPAAGVFSAVGLCVADVQFSQSCAFKRTLSDNDAQDLKLALEGLNADVRRRLGCASNVRVLRRAKMRYLGQGFELSVPIPDLGDHDAIVPLREAFESEYAHTYGLRLGRDYAVEIVALDVTALESVQQSDRSDTSTEYNEFVEPNQFRHAYFGPDHGLRKTPVTDRNVLTSTRRSGPWIVEEYEGTTVIPPDADFWLDEHQNIAIELRSETTA
jgi:N-methylhydantoinase A